MTSIRVAILQPTFLPWLGWFDIADQVDRLVILDDVGFSKQSWQQRNRIRTANGLAFATVPVRTSGRLGQSIIDTELADVSFAGKLERTITLNYGRAPFYSCYGPAFRDVLGRGASTGRLVDLNCELIQWLMSCLGVTTPTVRSSTLPVTGKRGGYVASLCAHLGAGRYLSPVGSEAYLLEDRAEFDTRNIEVELHAYEHPTYSQVFTPFMPFACAADLLFNEGDDSGRILRSGRRPSRPLGTPSVQTR